MTASDILIVFTIILFILGTTILIGNTVISKVLTDLGNTPTINASSEAKAVLTATNNNVIYKLDYVFVGVMIGVVLAIIISSWIFGAHPMFLIVYFIISLFSGVIGAILSYVWYRMSQNEIFSQTIIHLPYMNYIMEHFVMFIIAVSLIGMFVIFGKPYIGGGMQR